MKLFISICFTLLFLSGYAQSNSSYQRRTNTNIPVVDAEINAKFSATRKRFEQVRNKWPITKEMILKDVDLLFSKVNNTNPTQQALDKAFKVYYMDFDIWRQVTTITKYLWGYFETGGIGDMKTSGSFKGLKSSDKVNYKGTAYTIEQLGNINYGIALKAFGLPRTAAICVAGLYQVYIGRYDIPNKKFLQFSKSFFNMNANGAYQGTCNDHFEDTFMISKGYNWF